MVVRAKERGPTAEALLLAAQGAEEASSIIGTVQVTRGEGETSDEAEIGFFAVDPDLQVGRERLLHKPVKRLLHKPHDHCLP